MIIFSISSLMPSRTGYSKQAAPVTARILSNGPKKRLLRYRYPNFTAIYFLAIFHFNISRIISRTPVIIDTQPQMPGGEENVTDMGQQF
jgi:hypothetical protein